MQAQSRAQSKVPVVIRKETGGTRGRCVPNFQPMMTQTSSPYSFVIPHDFTFDSLSSYLITTLIERNVQQHAESNWNDSPTWTLPNRPQVWKVTESCASTNKYFGLLPEAWETAMGKLQGWTGKTGSLFNSLWQIFIEHLLSIRHCARRWEWKNE